MHFSAALLLFRVPIYVPICRKNVEKGKSWPLVTSGDLTFDLTWKKWPKQLRHYFWRSFECRCIPGVATWLKSWVRGGVQTPPARRARRRAAARRRLRHTLCRVNIMLTALICFRQNPNKIVVLVRKHVRDFDGDQIRIKLRNIKIHPSYNDRNSDNDIALLE